MKNKNNVQKEYDKNLKKKVKKPVKKKVKVHSVPSYGHGEVSMIDWLLTSR